MKRRRLNRRVRKILLSLVTAILVATGLLAKDFTGGLVVDGDTLRFDGEKVRLWGIDAPELRQTCMRHGMEYGCGQEAKAALARLVGDAMISCTPVDKDKYGRTVGRCVANGHDIAAEMVSQGWALDQTQYSKGAYAMMQIQAQVRKKGVWAGPVDPAWRARVNQ